jgi:hypothetical protein
VIAFQAAEVFEEQRMPAIIAVKKSHGGMLGEWRAAG